MEWKPLGRNISVGKTSSPFSTQQMMGGGGGSGGSGSRPINTPYRPKSPRERMLDDAVRQGIARSKAARSE